MSWDGLKVMSGRVDSKRPGNGGLSLKSAVWRAGLRAVKGARDLDYCLWMMTLKCWLEVGLEFIL